MTGQQPDLTLWQRSEPIVIAHHAPLRALDPRREVVEGAWPELAGLDWEPPSVGLLAVPISSAVARAALFFEDGTVSAAQCDICGSPVSQLLRSGDPDVNDGDLDLVAWGGANLFMERWMRAHPCGHRTSDVDTMGSLATVWGNQPIPQQVTDWLHTWARYYGMPRPDPVDPNDSPPALFDSEGAVLTVWQP